jgi:hypothetical protein
MCFSKRFKNIFLVFFLVFNPYIKLTKHVEFAIVQLSTVYFVDLVKSSSQLEQE